MEEATTSTMANQKVVPPPHTVSNSTTIALTSMSMGSHSAIFRSPTPSTPRGMEAFRQRFRAAGVSRRAALVLLASCRDSTHKQCKSAWRAWSQRCSELAIDAVSAPVNTILDFLVDREDAGLAYRSLTVYRTAIPLYNVPRASQ